MPLVRIFSRREGEKFSLPRKAAIRTMGWFSTRHTCYLRLYEHVHVHVLATKITRGIIERLIREGMREEYTCVTEMEPALHSHINELSTQVEVFYTNKEETLPFPLRFFLWNNTRAGYSKITDNCLIDW